MLSYAFHILLAVDIFIYIAIHIHTCDYNDDFLHKEVALRNTIRQNINFDKYKVTDKW